MENMKWLNGEPSFQKEAKESFHFANCKKLALAETFQRWDSSA
jgi:hypothetical protein